ncbi:DUF3710 domain-containing protein [Cellulomonas fimi]|uniref:DUF3710 domain-containing protein n=1 Tax=Cellulomonas fimi (strain ATCC 484 / DSM 20113 / JCM 1341 / CCUG 24087 / LMG 16345 / NBRC 15513 / NCIMB 8980 / NCTC 7547 / NRS-133) TaxID=590998 RepID=F4H1H6_CELFA|nr:DUF3710 domain-containing protein [Cellulomonas fimi]AEE46275.1 hypothetical protein Celf_2147 [Cellulomonas fimi ATCC 484]NNH06214.1 DUF3710 domain-containing protein [Cellulomonas fimi]VEH32331.1 Protein of uncharacterised function (DUF3710) [Cellulomonas fimi]
MALFRRGGKDSAADDVVDVEVAPQEAAAASPSAGSSRSTGPWDAEEVTDDIPRVDLGAIRLPGLPGMELRMEIDKSTNVVSAASVLLDGSSLQVQAFAAPRTEGIWDEIRGEIAESVTAQGGSVDEVPGPFGRELLARLPVRTPEGRSGHRPARFIGTDGPRWFLRGVITGKGAVEPAAAEALEQLYARIVVVRGTEARPPRDLLALRLPGPAQAPAAAPAQETPSFDPLTRGPEITEIR